MIELDPGEAAEELLARLLDAHRYRATAQYLDERLNGQRGFRFRSAPLPRELRRASLVEARAVYEPRRLAGAIGDLLRVPEPIDVRHMATPVVSLGERLTHLRELLRRGRFKFDEAIARADRMTVAVTLFAVLELYKQGELTWEQEEPFGEITIAAPDAAGPAAQAREAHVA